MHQAREAAKARGKGGTRTAKRRSRTAAARRDGREPTGFAAVLQGLMADRAWDIPAAGGSILDQWPAIAAAISPNLPAHIAAVAFHAESGQLDVRPDTPAYATQLRLITPRIIAAANETTGTTTVRTVRVLPAGPVAAPGARAADIAPAVTIALEAAPVKPRETASPGYQEALAAHQASKKGQAVAPEIRAAAERQARDQAREPEALFGDGHQCLEELRERATCMGRAASVDAGRARALKRVAAERADRGSGSWGIQPETGGRGCHRRGEGAAAGSSRCGSGHPVRLRRVVLTGATGFIGSAVLGELASHRAKMPGAPAFRIRVVGRRLPRDASAWSTNGFPLTLHSPHLDEVCEETDVLLYLAASLSSDEAECTAANVRGTAALMREAVRSGTGRIIHLTAASRSTASWGGRFGGWGGRGGGGR
ncbi:DciA family protein [Streptomyces syringium]|uniref:DciA family protein n=1 Tax=Streptomyces syringium TaxID=76729 RepID=UPI0033DF652E